MRSRSRRRRHWAVHFGSGGLCACIGELLGDGAARGRDGPGSDRPDLGPGVGRRSRCQRIGKIGTTVMRHFLCAALAVAALARGVVPGAAAGVLVAGRRQLLGVSAGQWRTALAVSLASVTPRTDQKALVASGAAQRSRRGAALRVHLCSSPLPGGWTSSARCATCLRKPHRGGYGQARGVSLTVHPGLPGPGWRQRVGNSSESKEM